MKYNFVLCSIISFSLVGCVSSHDLDAKSSAPNKDGIFIAENYQTVFARTSRMAKNCLPNGPAGLLSPVTDVVESNLYNELGYGEIKNYQRNITIIPWVNARINKSNNGTIVTVNTANMIDYAQNKTKNNIIDWAKGKNEC